LRRRLRGAWIAALSQYSVEFEQAVIDVEENQPILTLAAKDLLLSLGDEPTPDR
jgi:hypothetical protein